MATRTIGGSTFEMDQIMYSFMRYRKDHFYDKNSFMEQMNNHFNPELTKLVGNELFEKREIQRTLKENRESLESRGKLPKWEYTNKELKEAKDIRKWHIVTIKGRKVRAHQVSVKIKGREEIRYRDSYGRFTSNPHV